MGPRYSAYGVEVVSYIDGSVSNRYTSKCILLMVSCSTLWDRKYFPAMDEESTTLERVRNVLAFLHLLSFLHCISL